MSDSCYSVRTSTETTAPTLARVVMLPETVGVEVNANADGTNTIYVWTADAPDWTTLAAYEVAVAVWHKRHDRLHDALAAVSRTDAETAHNVKARWRLQERLDEAMMRRAALYILLPAEVLDRDA